MEKLIQVIGLRKEFRVAKREAGLVGALKGFIHPVFETIHAVADINFELDAGEMIGYLGPNGAGKSTTLKILSGLLVPTSGDVIVNGMVPWKKRTQYVRSIGTVFGQRSSLWWDLPVIDSLELLQAMYGVERSRFEKNLSEFTELLEMGPFMNSPVRSLSLGQKMRADLCAALMHEPRLLFLDEPTIGLDVVAKERIRNFIQYVNQERETTVILTTHDISDVEKLCERVIIIDHGKLLYDGKLMSLINQYEKRRLMTIQFAEKYEALELDEVDIIHFDGIQAEIAFDRQIHNASELIQQIAADYRIADVEVKRPEIEETIRRIYEEKLLVS